MIYYMHEMELRSWSYDMMSRGIKYMDSGTWRKIGPRGIWTGSCGMGRSRGEPLVWMKGAVDLVPVDQIRARTAELGAAVEQRCMRSSMRLGAPSLLYPNRERGKVREEIGRASGREKGTRAERGTHLLVGDSPEQRGKVGGDREAAPRSC